LKNCEPSRFLDDVDQRFIKVSTKFGGLESVPPSSQYAKNLINGIKKTVSSQPVVKKQSATAYKPPADFAPSDTSALQAGMKVEHPKFGFGTVVQMDMSGADRKARIEFSEVGEKTLLLSFAKLRIVQ
jgi:DNA helicase-2/ATP-dependent DNA helicase PcrA